MKDIDADFTDKRSYPKKTVGREVRFEKNHIIETGYRGITTASISWPMHRTDAISKIESLGFEKLPESISMTKRL